MVERLTELSVSLVIPVLNEEATIASFLRSLQQYRSLGAQVIVVDGGSEDRTAELAETLCDHLVVSGRGRARQMNAGAAVAGNNVLLFLHADTILPKNLERHIQAFQSTAHVWGRFNVKLSGRKAMFSVISFMMNWRSRITGIATGDQAIFITRTAFDLVGGYADISLMEDVDICKKLIKLSRPYCVVEPVITSSRRWEEKGVWPTILLMWKLRWKYYRGVSPEVLVREYYGG